MAASRATYPGIDWLQQVEYAPEQVSKHGPRRAQEMREADEMVADLGVDNPNRNVKIWHDLAEPLDGFASLGTV